MTSTTAAPPVPRPGAAGLWDHLVGPGATRAENLLVLGSAAAGTAATGAYLAWRGAAPALVAVGCVLAFDLLGGVVSNATETTKRWYHRPETGVLRHLGFVLSHVLHVLVAAWLFRGGDWAFFAVTSAYLVAAAGVLAGTSTYLKRPVAMLCYLGALGLWIYLLGPTPGLEWFLPVLFLKLLVGHMVPELPWRAPSA